MKITSRSLAVLAVLVTSTSIASAEQDHDVPAPKKTEALYISPVEHAQSGLAAWQKSRRECFSQVGLKEGPDWRFRPGNPRKTQTNDNLWLRPDMTKERAAEIEKCR